MATEVTSISALGTSGDALGKLFTAKPNRNGRYVLNRKRPSGAQPSTNMAASKVFVSTLDEAANLLATDDYLINLVSASGKRALRQYSSVKIVRSRT